MKNFLKILILPIALIIVLGGFAPHAYAVTPLVVDFDPDPLFDEANFLPLDETSGTVTVTNNSGEEQDILTEAINILDNDDFGSLLRLTIVGSSGTLFDDSLADFFSTAGEVPLGAISDGESKVFTYTVSFINSSDNSYQGKMLGFDICVGFEGGATHCGDTIVGGENDTDGGGGTGNPPSGGTIPGSGGGGGSYPLAVYNEQAGDVDTDAGTATIEWDTNFLSTSQVIYGLASGGPYLLDLSILPNLGYPLGTAETSTKVLHHSVPLTGLSPGETYVYRVVSRASPPTVSVERQFTTLALASPPAGSAPSAGSEQAGSGAVDVTGGGFSGTIPTLSVGTPTASLVGAGTSSEETAAETPNAQVAAALAGSPLGFLEFLQSFNILLILLVTLGALIAWFVWRHYNG